MSLPGALAAYLASVPGAAAELLELAGVPVGSPQYPGALRSLLGVGDTAELASLEEGTEVLLPGALSAYLDSVKGGSKDLVRPAASPLGSPQYPGPLQNLLGELLKSETAEVSLPGALSAYLGSVKGGAKDLARPAASPVGLPQYPGPLETLLRVVDTDGIQSVGMPAALSSYLGSLVDGSGFGAASGMPVYPGPLHSLLKVEENADGLEILEASPEGASLPGALSGYLASLQSESRAVDLPVATAVGRGTPQAESVEEAKPFGLSSYLASVQSGLQTLVRSVLQPSTWGVSPNSEADTPTSEAPRASPGTAAFFDPAGGSGATASPVGSPQYPASLQRLLRVEDAAELRTLEESPDLSPQEAPQYPGPLQNLLGELPKSDSGQKTAEVSLPGALSAYLASVEGEIALSNPVLQPLGTFNPEELQTLLRVADTSVELDIQSVGVPAALSSYLDSLVDESGETAARVKMPAALETLLVDTDGFQSVQPLALEMGEVVLPGALAAYLATAGASVTSKALPPPALTPPPAPAGPSTFLEPKDGHGRGSNTNQPQPLNPKPSTRNRIHNP